MKRNCSPVTAALGAALLAACAGERGPQAEIAVGSVQAIYLERAPGVYVDHRVSPDGSDARRWAAVVLRTPLANGLSFTTAAVDGDVPVEVGDLVELEVGIDAPDAHVQARVSGIVSPRAERAARLNIKGPRWAS